jgi:nucleoside-diphosphate-sugar epimerase
MRLLVTGATGFLGWRAATLLAERDHDIVPIARPDGRSRPHASGLDPLRVDAGNPEARRLVADCDAVLHFAGVPDPASASADPARAVRENVGSTLNLLEGCGEHGAGLVYPSTLRAAVEPPPDAYALSKRLGEDVCRLHPAPAAVLRLPSVFGPGQVAGEGATGAIAAFAARALDGRPIVIGGNPLRTRDFLYADDLVLALEQLVEEGRWGETTTLATGVATPLVRAAELVRDAVGTAMPIETTGEPLPPGEDESYEGGPPPTWLRFAFRPLEEAVLLYVDWLTRHSAAQGRARA